MCSALGSRTEPSSRSARGHTASSRADVTEVPAGKERHLVAERDQFLREPRHDTFGAAIKLGRNRFRQRCNLRNVHRIRPSLDMRRPRHLRVPDRGNNPQSGKCFQIGR